MSKDFWKQNEEKQREILNQYYNKEQLSWIVIASMLDSYPNKIRRLASKLGIESRSKSQAQALALSNGRHDHPTKGTKRPEETKLKISESQGKVWDSLDEKEREERSKIGVESWKKKSKLEKELFFKKGAQAINKASRNGSKVEQMIFDFLSSQGLLVDKHKEYSLKNEKFHIDLYVPKYKLAIEIDGPMHFKPVFGEEKLIKRQAADLSKNGLILGSGMILLRVKLCKRESQRYYRYIISEITRVIDQIKTKFPDKEERYIEI